MALDAYRSFGDYHCPMCFCMREFIAYDEQITDAGKAECFVCGYRFGKKVDEMHLEEDATGRRYICKTTPVLSEEKVRKAKARRLEEHRRMMLNSGVRREVLDGRAARKATDR